MKTLTIILSFLFTLPVMAEPSSATSYLMDEPVSLMDLAIYKLDRAMRRGMDRSEDYLLRLKIQSELGGASYDWDSNRIVLYYDATFDEEALGSKMSSKVECKLFIEHFRSKLFSINTDAEIITKPAEYELIHYFGHEGGYKSKKQPENFYEEIAKMIYFKVQVLERTEKEPYVAWHTKCEGPLLGDKVLFSE